MLFSIKGGKMKKIHITYSYSDLLLKRFVNKGEIIEVDDDRAEKLVEYGIGEIVEIRIPEKEKKIVKKRK